MPALPVPVQRNLKGAIFKMLAPHRHCQGVDNISNSCFPFQIIEIPWKSDGIFEVVRFVAINLFPDISLKHCNKYSHFLVQTAIKVISSVKQLRVLKKKRGGGRKKKKKEGKKRT